MIRPVSLLALCAALLPLPATAQDVLSAELELGLARNMDTEVNFKRVEGSFMTNFAGRYNLQLDFGMSKYEANGSTSPFMALHLVYEAGPHTDLGLFLSGEDRLGLSYSLLGVEIAHSIGALELQGYAGIQDRVDSGGFNGDIYGFDLSYDFGPSQQWGLLFGTHMADIQAAPDRDTVYLGLSKRLANGIELETRVSQHDTNETVISVAAHIKLGDGVRFNRRDFFQNFPDY